MTRRRSPRRPPRHRRADQLPWPVGSATAISAAWLFGVKAEEHRRAHAAIGLQREFQVLEHAELLVKLRALVMLEFTTFQFHY